MNPLNLLRDTWFFFSRNLLAIAALCLPWTFLQTLAEHALAHWFAGPTGAAYGLLAGLVLYPLYSGALILLADARSSGLQPRRLDLLAAALRLWPRFALLAGLSTLLIMLGASLLVLPALWIMVKLAFAEYLLVLRGLPPLAAMQASMQLTKGCFWQIAACLLLAMAPLWLLDWLGYRWLGEQPDEWLSLLLDSALGFAQLFVTLLLFRLYMQLDHAPTAD
jgi:hypothetical protein